MVNRIDKEHPDKGLGKRISEARKTRGWSQEKLKGEIGVNSKGVISSWEREKNFPSNDNLQKLADVLGIEVNLREYNEQGRRKQGECVCKVCGKVFSIYHRKLFCDKVCANKYKSETYRGENSFNYKGYKPWMTVHGYMMVRAVDHPNADKRGYVREHVLVMEEKIGRYLEDTETVHHMNGIRHDNRPENLELWQGHHGTGIRARDWILDRLSKVEQFQELNSETQKIVLDCIRKIYD